MVDERARGGEVVGHGGCGDARERWCRMSTITPTSMRCPAMDESCYSTSSYGDAGELEMAVILRSFKMPIYGGP